MTVAYRWIKAVLASAAHLPLLRELQAGTRKGALLGAAVGLLLLFPLGALLGYVNRGAAGALIGAISGSLGGVVLGSVVGGIVGTYYLPQEGHAALVIKLERQSARFRPGESVTGHVRVTVEDTLRISDAKAYCVCRGFYTHDEIDERRSGQPRFVRSSREYLVQQAKLIPPTTIRRGVSQSCPFHFTLPFSALPSHYGYVCSVRWTVHALLDVPDIPPIRTHREFFVESAPRVPLGTANQCQSVGISRMCQLVLDLPRAVYAEGETLSGQVRIIPSLEFDAQEVRAILLRVENVQASDDHIVYVVDENPESGTARGQRREGGQGTTYVWLEGEDNLSGPFTFRSGETVAHPFSIPIPSHWRPTLSTEDGSVIWKVGVIVSRSGAKDVRAFHEVIVHTGAPRIGGRAAAGRAGPAVQQ